MRQIGTFNTEADARRLGDHLETLGIGNKIVPGKAGWSLWVHDEDRVPRAIEEYAAYIRNPLDPRYLDAPAAARKARKARDAEEAEHRKRSKDLRDRWEGGASGKYPLTLALILASVVIALQTDFGQYESSGLFHAMLFSDHTTVVDLREGVIRVRDHGLADIARGQIWRLVTPIFLHFSPIHLIFNMVALRVYGGTIEFRKSRLRLGILVLVSAIVSNSGQYLYQAMNEDFHPFGGMSGVVYALFGYLWVKGHQYPEERIGVHSNSVVVMILWFFLCMTGWAGPIANSAHGVGLAVGMAFGLTRF